MNDEIQGRRVFLTASQIRIKYIQLLKVKSRAWAPAPRPTPVTRVCGINR